jgi:hypothetical protein
MTAWRCSLDSRPPRPSSSRSSRLAVRGDSIPVKRGDPLVDHALRGGDGGASSD